MFDGQHDLTEKDIPWLKAYLADGGGIFIGENLARAAKHAGFEEGVHYHILKPIPTENCHARDC